MKKNMGNVDRIIRAIVGIVLLVLITVVSGWLQILFGVLGAILLITAATGVCLIYIPLGFSTDKKNK